MRIIAIVPNLPPAIDGVGDYALHLARQLRQDRNIHTCFIVCNPLWAGSSDVDGFPVHTLSDRSSNALLNLLTCNSQYPFITLLQFSGYGYARWGCPWWLIHGLERWKKKTGQGQLVTMFHELYNKSAPPWKHNFWTSPIQKYLAVRLVHASDRCLTSGQNYAETLITLSRNKNTQIPVLPIFSNIGEPQTIPPLPSRKKRLVIFGQQGTRTSAYKSISVLDRVCQSLQIKEIWDIGPSIELTIHSIGECPIIELGQLPAAEISKILLDSVAGFVCYNPKFLAKSGIFAAYCAHGLLPVVHPWSSQTVDNLEVGQHYWHPENSLPSIFPLEDQQAIADCAFSWYQNHALPNHSNIFAHLVCTQSIPSMKVLPLQKSENLNCN
jgi:hypothetical protein